MGLPGSQTSTWPVDHQPAFIPAVQSSDALLPARSESASSLSSSSSTPRIDRSAGMGVGGNGYPLDGEKEKMANFDHNAESKDSMGGR